MIQTDVKNAVSDHNSSLVTILTPAYNRCSELENLYRSLCGQTQQCFDWLIVDDGSRDQTRETVQAWIQEAPFSIRYLYKENGGKHTALNLGISKIIAPLTFIVDSDDTLARIMKSISRFRGRRALEVCVFCEPTATALSMRASFRKMKRSLITVCHGSMPGLKETGRKCF